MTDKAKIFESFNARALSPEQVAATFVPSSHFERLSKRRHSLIVGPRGSGKTTLLKMLQQRALEHWEHKEADGYRARIDYTGIFVPTDITWAMQLQLIGFGELDDRTRQLFGYAAFTTHVLRALIDAFISKTAAGEAAHPHGRIAMVPQCEAEITTRIAQAWRCTPLIPSFFSIHEALGLRLQQIYEIAAAEALRGPDGRNDRILAHEFMTTQFLSAAGYAVDVFTNTTGHRAKWAFLFDELEIAPAWIRRELLSLLRSTDSRFLFKLSMSPYDADTGILGTEASAAAGNDYDDITLWYGHKEEGYGFAEALWESITEAYVGAPVTAYDALGHAFFETTAAEWAGGTAYRSGGRLGNDFEELWKGDGTFREFMINRGIDVRMMHELSGGERAELVRKMAPVVYFRKEFRKAEQSDRDVKGARGQAEGRGGPKKDPILSPLPEAGDVRSRKNPQVYTGAEALFAISEGNPRWLISIADRLMEYWPQDGGRIDRGVQAATIVHAARGFAALLRNVPSPLRSERGILELVSRIGDFIFEQVVRKPFNPEPPGSFRVDAHITPAVERALGVALNMGAIVFLPGRQDSVLLRSVRGKRFRLSYLLSVVYRNPIRLGRDVNLSTILKDVPADQTALEWVRQENDDGDSAGRA